MRHRSPGSVNPPKAARHHSPLDPVAQVQRSVATLRISEDKLDPTEITSLLGCAPDAAQTRGEEIPGRNSGSVRVARMGMWRLSATDREPEDLDAQNRKLLYKLTDDLTVWTSIAERYGVDLFLVYSCARVMKVSRSHLNPWPLFVSAESSAVWIFMMAMIDAVNQSLPKVNGTYLR